MTIDSVLELLRGQPQSEAELERLAQQAHQLPAAELEYLIETRPATESALLFRVLDKPTALQVFEGLPSEHQA